MPQLDVGTFGNQIFWLLLALVAIYLVLSRVALPRIAAILAERQGTITNDVAAAEDLKAKAERPKLRMKRRLRMPALNRIRIAGETKAKIQGDLDVAIAKADARLLRKRQKAKRRLPKFVLVRLRPWPKSPRTRHKRSWLSWVAKQR